MERPPLSMWAHHVPPRPRIVMRQQHRHHLAMQSERALGLVTRGNTGRAGFGKPKDPKGQQGTVVIVKAVIGIGVGWGQSPCGAGLRNYGMRSWGKRTGGRVSLRMSSV